MEHQSEHPLERLTEDSLEPNKTEEGIFPFSSFIDTEVLLIEWSGMNGKKESFTG